MADWSVPKNEFSTGQAAQGGAGVHAAAAAQEGMAAGAPQEATASEGGSGDDGSKAKEPDTGTARTSKGTPASSGRHAAVGAGGEEGGGEVLGDTAVHVRPGEKRMYEDILAGLLSDKDGFTQQPVKGQKREAARDQEAEPRKKEAKDTVGAKDEGTAGKKGKKPTWEGERSEAPAGQKQGGSGLIQRQVFVRNLPLDVLPSELSSCMERFGDVKACRCASRLARHVPAPMTDTRCPSDSISPWLSTRACRSHTLGGCCVECSSFRGGG